MGASTIPSTYLLPELLPAYKKLCPETYFNIYQSDSQGILDKILEGSFNLGLVGMTSEDDRFCFEPFYQDQMVLITPKNAYFEELKSSGTPINTILKKRFGQSFHTFYNSITILRTLCNFLESYVILDDRLWWKFG